MIEDAGFRAETRLNQTFRLRNKVKGRHLSQQRENIFVAEKFNPGHISYTDRNFVLVKQVRFDTHVSDDETSQVRAAFLKSRERLYKRLIKLAGPDCGCD